MTSSKPMKTKTVKVANVSSSWTFKAHYEVKHLESFPPISLFAPWAPYEWHQACSCAFSHLNTLEVWPMVTRDINSLLTVSSLQTTCDAVFTYQRCQLFFQFLCYILCLSPLHRWPWAPFHPLCSSVSLSSARGRRHCLWDVTTHAGHGAEAPIRTSASAHSHFLRNWKLTNQSLPDLDNWCECYRGRESHYCETVCRTPISLGNNAKKCL